MTMMKSAATLFALVVLATTSSSTNAQLISDECKGWRWCCDSEYCNNDECNLRPVDDPSCTTTPIVPPYPVVEGVCNTFFQFPCCRDADGCGDPHFRTWGAKEHFDFHGQCDINFVHAPSFGQGLGMDVHVRTKTRTDFSFIESVAIRIGAKEVLEIAGWGIYFVDGVLQGRNFPFHLAAFTVTHKQIDDHIEHYTIELGEGGQSLVIKTFKDYVSVHFNMATSQNFLDSTGLLGDFLSGKKLARDGTTVMSDDIAYGQEWQVLDTEPQLFQVKAEPQYPTKCTMPAMTADGRRILGESKVSMEDAQAACRSASKEYMHACIYDVLATGDLEMAQAGAY